MTILVGIKAKDGIVLASDSASTSNVDKILTNKISIYDNKFLFATAGDVGLGQRVSSILENQRNEILRINAVETGKAFCREIHKDLSETNLIPNNLPLGAILAVNNDIIVVTEKTIQLFIVSNDDWYTTMGSARFIASPFLGYLKRSIWNEQPDLEDAKLIATWAIHHSIQTAPSGVDKPINVAVIQNGHANYLTKTEIDSLQKEADEIENFTRQYKRFHKLNREELAA